VGGVPRDDEVEERLDAGWSVSDIAQWAGCSAKSVRNVAHAAGLELPQARRRAARLDELYDDLDALQGWLEAGESAPAIANRLSVSLADVRTVCSSRRA
jgi:hypothetical protein